MEVFEGLKKKWSIKKRREYRQQIKKGLYPQKKEREKTDLYTSKDRLTHPLLCSCLGFVFKQSHYEENETSACLDSVSAQIFPKWKCQKQVEEGEMACVGPARTGLIALDV